MENLHVVHPLAECISKLVGIVVVILAVERLTDIDDDLLSLERGFPGMRLLLCSGPNLICTRDIYRYERNARFNRDIGCTVLHRTELAVMCSCSFREDEADIALLNFLLSLDKSSYGVAVSVNGDASSDLHYQASKMTVICLEVSTDQGTHPLEVTAWQKFIDKHSVSKALVVSSDNIRIVLRKIIPSYASEIC